MGDERLPGPPGPLSLETLLQSKSETQCIWTIGRFRGACGDVFNHEDLSDEQQLERIRNQGQLKDKSTEFQISIGDGCQRQFQIIEVTVTIGCEIFEVEQLADWNPAVEREDLEGGVSLCLYVMMKEKKNESLLSRPSEEQEGRRLWSMLDFSTNLVDAYGAPLWPNRSLLFNPGFNPDDEEGRIYELGHLRCIWKEQALHIPDDVLRIQFTLKDSELMQLHDYKTLHTASLKNLRDDLADMFHTGLGSDFQIVCKDGSKFDVHQTILSCRSPVFARMLSADMKEKDSKMVEVEDIDPIIMKQLLEYMYSSKIKLGKQSLDQLFDLIEAADKYQVMSLKEICFNYATRRLSSETAGKIALFAHKYSASPAIRWRVFEYCGKNWMRLCMEKGFRDMVASCPGAFTNEDN